jgi:hypothetical protein
MIAKGVKKFNKEWFLIFALVLILFFECFGGQLPTKALPMEAETPLPKFEKHDLPIGALWQRKRL